MSIVTTDVAGAGAERQRHLPWQGCFNVRDVGGYPTVDGGRTRWGALIRSDDLGRLTPEGEASLVDYGVRTIVDLRSGWELEAPHPFRPVAPPTGEATGADVPAYLNLTLRDLDDAHLDRALNASSSVAEAYCLFLDHGAASFARIARAFTDAPPGGVLVHCAAGKDRTGLIVAVLLALAGVRDDAIVADYRLTEERLRPF